MNAADRNSSRRSSTQRRPHTSTLGTLAVSTQRRRRSRSPDGQPSQQQHPPSAPSRAEISHADQNKRKKSGIILSHANSRSFLVSVDDVNPDRGRKPKTKLRSHNRYLVENAPHASTSCAPENPSAASKRGRSKSRESLKLPSKATTSDVDGSGREWQNGFIDTQFEYSGPLAAAEIARLKRELDNLKKLVHDNRKLTKKQNKVIEELKQQDNSLKQKLQESESQVSKLQNKSKKSDEVIATVESNTQCQVCMELLFKPYALSPCGHVLCVTCLQEWFRQAPAVEDEMYDNDDPDYLLRRRKTCPCCRTNVRHRPIPIFVIKAIVTAVAKGKGGSHAASSSSSEPASGDLDPWEGLFPCDDEEIDDYGASDDEDEDYDEDHGEDDDEDDDEDDEDSAYDGVFSYGTDSDEESYHGVYVHPQWEPPNSVIDEDDYTLDHLDESDLNCLRRGATVGMVQAYEMQYSHQEGLIAHDEGNHHIYLGWNIRLSADDENGEVYMGYIAEDMEARPDRWSIIEDEHDGVFEAHLLVPEEDLYDYRDSDSDNYMEIDGSE
ncbi:hypothetical protein PAXRUDRAFT_825015 [Paxillus rubicundulus Ve08.2h10]|uniref:RING-type domain-containing protein n=1 Tax=Paxillus rubicundulus Ve08.2h10 TaxID=930991 RepID=A0A0D0DGZ5_9AGAM|nr:hypothetical protein PAXRUDRAFT_825015 [Paxillus rubicundulus Ve08.2h10]